MLLALILAVLSAPILLIVFHDVIRRPTLRRLAARNVVRRKGEAVLVVLGSLLATAIITAALIMAGTFSSSIRNYATSSLGPVDEVVRVKGIEPLDAVEKAITASPLPETDGVMRALIGGAAVATTGEHVRAEPFASMIELDFEAARRFGDDVSSTGFEDAGETPRGSEVVIGEGLAAEIDVEEGDRIVLNAYGQAREVTIRGIVERKGMAGFDAPNVFVSPGTIAAMSAGGTGAVASPPTGVVVVSNTGGVYSGAERSDQVKAELERRLAAVPSAEVRSSKADLLEEADSAAAEFVTLFGGFGAFSVIAGILLLINIFVMLAEERKTELGMLRAVGLKQNQLVRAFGMEGAIYAVVSAVAGAVVGIGVGRLMVGVAQGVVTDDDSPFNLDLVFTASPRAVLTGLLVGAAIALVTVWGASLRIGRLNVIRAIRDIPEPVLTRQRVRTLVFAAVGVVLGGLMLMNGVGQKQWFGALAGPPIAAFSAIPLLARIAPRRLAVTGLCAFALFWGVAVFTILPDSMKSVDIPAFVVQGMILVGASVAILAANDDIAVKLTDKLSGSNRTLAARLGFAYPLARRFRTAMLLGMYALIVFTLTFMSVFSNLFSKQGPRFTEETRAGHDVLVDSNYANPVPIDVLRQQRDVESVAPILRGFPEWSSKLKKGGDRVVFPVSGFDKSLLVHGQPKLSSRLPRLADERAVWDAVLADPSLVIISDFFLQEGGGPPDALLEVGDKVTMFNRLTGARQELTVAAKIESDWVEPPIGAFVGAPFAQSFLGSEVVASRFYVQVKGDPESVAPALNGRLLQYGVDAETFASIIDGGLQQQQGFLRLMQGYIALGLLIGIAGLGVVMIRAVRDRRRQIGMLRAMGFSSRIVRTSFLLEAGFVALQGIVLGVVLALVVSYQLLSNSETFGDSQLGFEVPWLALGLLTAASLGASLLATTAPASQAARIKPAVALRIAD